jgi:hypothetical protein
MITDPSIEGAGGVPLIITRSDFWLDSVFPSALESSLFGVRPHYYLFVLHLLEDHALNGTSRPSEKEP